MQTEEENQLEKNDLVEAMKKFRTKLTSGEFLNTRILSLAAILAIVIGTWWYLRGTTRTSDAEMWKSFNELTGSEAFEKYADAHTSSSLNRISRLQQARYLLAQDGIPNLTSINPDSRKKGIESIEKARDLFAKLAGEFQDDLTLKGQCLEGNAKAELSLVGIPKTDNPNVYRGDAKKAAELYRQYAALVGDKTPTGELLAKKAKELDDKADELKALGMSLDNKYSPKAPVEEPKLPMGIAPAAVPPIGTVPVAPASIVPPSVVAPSVPAVPPPSPPSAK